MPPYQENNCTVYTGDPKKTFSVMGEKHAKGLTMSAFNDSSSGYALCNLNGQYKSLSFDVGHQDEKYGGDKNLYVYLDNQLIKEVALTGQGQTQHIDLDVSGGLQLKFELLGESGASTGYGSYALFNMILN